MQEHLVNKINERNFGVSPSPRETISYQYVAPITVKFSNGAIHQFDEININDPDDVYHLEPLNIPLNEEVVIERYADFIALVGQPDVRLEANAVPFCPNLDLLLEDVVILPLLTLTHANLTIKGSNKRTDGHSGPGVYLGLFSEVLANSMRYASERGPDTFEEAFNWADAKEITVKDFCLMYESMFPIGRHKRVLENYGV